MMKRANSFCGRKFLKSATSNCKSGTWSVDSCRYVNLRRTTNENNWFFHTIYIILLNIKIYDYHNVE